ncbi:DUF3999 domain-containing protein [Pinisolibacter aquiterrae]|uniref:DUF3999 domain-containing protein n=1 Tax=Pinisolibacter aquiterrae TaxID=2815579 RepID=UPI001C3D11C7|nr:DUF3999 domain-containing protein [Pinisolibacter aquiterrae]MBV5263879.1 DUF3999 domain-containing protein [Pinisolibacter aquiterrae]MCC8235737.1 DUF3999 domain-containing protein [Pinisolibacter aquiterrae]
MRRIGPLGALVLFALSGAQAAEPRLEIRHALEISGDTGFHAFVVPPQIYAESRAAGLGDLVVRNGAGEKVPFTFETPKPAPTEEPAETRDVRWFEVPLSLPAEVRPGSGLAIRPDGTLVAVGSPVSPGQPQRIDVVDLGNGSDLARTLKFDLAPAPYQGRVKIDAAVDLEHWFPVTEVTLTRLGEGDDVIERSRVSLSVGGARYLRLRWVDPAPAIRRLSVGYAARDPEPARDWIRNIPVREVEDGVYEFDAGGRAPVDRVLVHPPQANTVAAVRLSSRTDVSAPWRFAGLGPVMVVKTGVEEATVRPIAVAPTGDRLWRMQVDTRSGGFGKGEPTVDIGWQPATVTFLARGAGPFELALGGVGGPSGAMPRAALLPPGDVAIGVARLGARLDPTSQPPISSEGGDVIRRMLLWMALIVAVAFLAFMARQMMKDPPSPSDTTTPPV